MINDWDPDWQKKETEKELIAEFLQDLKECKNKMYPGSLTNRKLDEKIEKWEGKS